MLEALFFWALALYGAMMIVWQSTQSLQRRTGMNHPQQMKIILVVQNVESSIEGVLRTLLSRTAYSSRERMVVVMDVRSTDLTGDIVHRLMEEYPVIYYIPVDDEDDLQAKLRAACVHSKSVSCVYDLRDYEMLRGIANDASSLFPT